MKHFKRVLIRIGISIMIAVAAVLIYYLLCIINTSRAFAPVQVVPLLIAVFFAATRLGVIYALIPLLTPPLYNILIKGIEPEPTNTPFILTIIILVELLFLLIVTGIYKIFIKNSAVLAALSYISGIAFTFIALKYGLFPYLPLLSLPTIMQNFLMGNVFYTILGFLIFEASGIALMNLKLTPLKGGEVKC